MNQDAKYLGQIVLQKLLSRHTDTHLTDFTIWTTKVVVKCQHAVTADDNAEVSK